MSFPRLRSEETEQRRQPQTATGQAEGQRAPGARPSSPSLLLALGLGVFFGVGACPPGKGGSSSMQPPLKMESSTEEESWLEDQWEKW